MNEKLQTIFICSAPAPSGLECRVMLRVRKAARIRFFEKIAVGGVSLAACAVALVFVGRETMSEMTSSGFEQYVSLLFSNSGAVLSDWGDFGWTILESAPITGIALCLGATGVLVGTIRWTGRTLGSWSGTMGKLAA